MLFSLLLLTHAYGLKRISLRTSFLERSNKFWFCGATAFIFFIPLSSFSLSLSYYMSAALDEERERDGQSKA